MEKSILERFASSCDDFRASPFWAWNARLSPGELRRQIREMKAMGLGGFFMHARVGLDTPYLKREWFRCIDACIDEARKNGMEAWLYDEDRWPSGAAGGLVTKNEAYREKKLCYEILEQGADSTLEGTTLAWYSASFQDGKLLKAERQSARPDTGTAIRFFWRYSRNSSWFNGYTYLDTMNEDAVKQFINTTHEAYLKHNGSDFGKTVPGIFSDEPCYTHFCHDTPEARGWSSNLETIFKKKYGYELEDHLPELFFDYGAPVSKARWHYYDLLTTLFVNAFAKQIGEWCGKHNLAFTGHVLEEDTLGGQTRYVGSAMRFYEYMQQPGIDLLTEHWNILNTMKQCSSAAHQFGWKRRLCETYGCTGWDFSFAGHKALGDILYASGINFRCQHLAWYSMAGQAKRDYPASISYQSPWANDYGGVEDYFARLGAVMTEGDEKRDLLLINPIESYWCLHAYDKNQETDNASAFNRSFIHVGNALLTANIDYDYGEEELLSRHGKVCGKTLKVGQANYNAVLIPPVLTLRKSTIQLLKAFIDAGGTVFCLGDAPDYVEAEPSPLAKELYAQCRLIREEELSDALTPLCRRLSIRNENTGKEADSMLYRITEGKNFCQVFTCNTGMLLGDDNRTAPFVSERTLTVPAATLTIHSAIEGEVYELKPLTGEIVSVPFQHANGSYVVRTSYGELESRLFFITAEQPPNLAQPTTAKPCSLSLPRGPWKIRTSEANVLVFDQARWALGDDALSDDTKFILEIDDLARQRLGAPTRGGAMIQPYLRHKKGPVPTLPVRLHYDFTVTDLPAQKCFLAVEYPKNYRVSLNGVTLNQEKGWWTDRCLRKLTIPDGTLKLGLNCLELECDYSEELPGLEASFLLGNFGVDAQDQIVAPPVQLEPGDWCKQGLPYYGGNLTYTMTLNRKPDGNPAMLDIGPWKGVALKVRVNGGKPHLLLWPPYQLDIADELSPKGHNRLDITVIGHRRNCFGPFYHSEVTPRWCGAGQLRAFLHTNRNLVPVGLMPSR